MRFGLFVPQGWRHDLVGIDPARQWEVMRSLAHHADGGDWDSIWVYDHFHTVPVPSQEATHEAWTLMAAFAASTSRVRLGTMCTCMSYRNPALLAKIAVTVDIVSGGRIEMGIGGGAQPGPPAGAGAVSSPSFQHEWSAYGYGSPSTGVRLGRLREGVEILRQAWGTGTATLDGKHYRVEGAIVRPLPLQVGGPPLWIAGGGEKVTLRIAAEYAQYTNYFANTPEEFDYKSAILQQHCVDVGTDFGAIIRSSNYDVVVGSTEAEVSERVDAIRARVLPYLGEQRADAFVAKYRQGAIGVGTPEQIVERLAAMQLRGMTYGIFYFPEAAYDRSGIELFERDVMPALA